MFNPKDFFELSKELYNIVKSESRDCILSPVEYEEALLRTLISRIYYSVFLICREWIKREFNIDIDIEAKKKDIGVHKMLVEVVKLRTNKIYLADYIDELRILRANSDYVLKLKIDASDVDRCIHIASEIFEDLGYTDC